MQAIHDERWSFDDSPPQRQYQLLWTDNRYFSWTVEDANDECLRKHGLQHVKDSRRQAHPRANLQQKSNRSKKEAGEARQVD